MHLSCFLYAIILQKVTHCKWTRCRASLALVFTSFSHFGGRQNVDGWCLMDMTFWFCIFVLQPGCLKSADRSPDHHWFAHFCTEGLVAELTFVRINDLATPPEPTHPLMWLVWMHKTSAADGEMHVVFVMCVSVGSESSCNSCPGGILNPSLVCSSLETV